MIMKYEDEKPSHQLFDNLEDEISILEMDIIYNTEKEEKDCYDYFCEKDEEDCISYHSYDDEDDDDF